MDAPRTVAELEARLSEPSEAAVAAIARCPGDIVVLGAGGKMGPSLCAMARRAADQAGPPRRVIAVSRFSSDDTAAQLAAGGVDVLRADLTDPAAYATLPDAANVIFMVGQKFGTVGSPGRTWFTNTVVPAYAADRYRDSRLVGFSTGNVYPLTPPARGGSCESDPPAPVGEYAQSCLGRERVLEHAAVTWGARITLLRLNYAVDLRYGVLVDLAIQVRAGQPVDLGMGCFNCIWQGDANALALAALGDCAAPAITWNLTGPEILSVRDVATEFGTRFGVAPVFTGEPAADALLSNASPLLARHGPVRVPASVLVDWVATWVGSGGPTSGRRTHFEQREGRF